VVIVFLVTVPFINDLAVSALVESVLVTLLLVSAVTAVGGRRKTLIIAVVLVAPALLGKWLQHLGSDLWSATVTDAAAIAFVAFVIGHLFRFILLAPRVNNEVLCAAVAAYLMLGILWAFAYLLLSRLDPRAFLIAAEPGRGRAVVPFEALFLSFGTLSNVGYGEVVAASKAARMLAMAQGMTGMFYLALLVARLVAIYTGEEATQEEHARDRGRPDPPACPRSGDRTH
jgi:hypothetical protein